MAAVSEPGQLCIFLLDRAADFGFNRCLEQYAKGSRAMRNLIDITDLSVEEIDQLIATAEDIIAILKFTKYRF